MNIDYRDLLKKYIDHVGNQEGVDFLHPTYFDRHVFTEDEWRELTRLSVEVQENYQ